jgi:hypothetical protein
MIDSSAQFKTLQQANQDAHQTLNRLTQDLIAIASAICFARSHFSTDDKWTGHDEMISRICAPLETILHDIAVLVASAKSERDIASNAVSDYHKQKNEAGLINDNVAIWT